MADNVAISAGTGTDIATDDVSSVHYQKVKIALGADGAVDALVDSGQQAMAASVPVVLASDHSDIKVTLDSEAVTANLGATDNAVLDDIAAKLGTIDADTSGVFGCIGGTELQVDVVAALPAGTNAIGKLAANSGVDIGDVDVTSVVPGTAATNLGKAEDAAHSSGDVGVMALAVRDDTIGALSGTDGDYEPLHTSANGALFVETIPGAAWYANGDYADAQTNTSLKAAPGASLSLYVTDIVVTNDDTAAITVKLLDGSGGTNLTGTHKIPASGGAVINLRTPIKLTANTALCVTTTGTSNFSVLATGYTAP